MVNFRFFFDALLWSATARCETFLFGWVRCSCLNMGFKHGKKFTHNETIKCFSIFASSDLLRRCDHIIYGGTILCRCSQLYGYTHDYVLDLY